MKKVRDIYLETRFFYAFGILVAMFAVSYVVKWFFPFAQTALVIALCIVLIEFTLLFRKDHPVKAARKVPSALSLGDSQKIKLNVQNLVPFELQTRIIDELPYQLQTRDFKIETKFAGNEDKRLEYSIMPNIRGEYVFDNLNLFISTKIGIISRRLVFPIRESVKVYPSIIQMKTMEIKALSSISLYQGIKRIRKLGHNYEFDHIKNYVFGDDSRSINWKASGRRADIMVNHYEDERSQQIYCAIDKSRSMKMPFNGLSLLDYAINTSLAISNIAMKKHDKAGLLTFSDKMDTIIQAGSKWNQLQMIMDALYNEKEHSLEANYEILYNRMRRIITRRSLIFLFTNFESYYSLERVLPILRSINKQHLLVVVFFKNSEITQFLEEECQDIQDIYNNVIAQKLLHEKEKIVQELGKYGIHSLLTKPEYLSINTLNKYLEFKAIGLI